MLCKTCLTLLKIILLISGFLHILFQILIKNDNNNFNNLNLINKLKIIIYININYIYIFKNKIYYNTINL